MKRKKLKKHCSICKGEEVIFIPSQTSINAGYKGHFEPCPNCRKKQISEMKSNKEKKVRKFMVGKLEMRAKIKYGQKDLSEWANREYQRGLDQIAEV